MIHLEINEPPHRFSITVVPGCIFLTGSAGYQVFKTGSAYTPEQECTRKVFAKDFRAVFPSKASLEKAAEFYTEGHTNKLKFKAKVERLLKEKMITEHDRNKLRTFIDGCDCTPSKVRARLLAMGWGPASEGMADVADFSDKDPRLEASVDALWSVISS